MSTFLQLVHVSDLHFGDRLYPRWNLTGWIWGLGLHDPHVAEALSNSIRTNVVTGQSTVPQHVIATGDLTTWGTPAAFQTALTYLRSRFFTGGGTKHWVGFNAPDASIVPGNHDIWGGVVSRLSLVTGLPPSTRDIFTQVFSQPSPLATPCHPDRPFPYQLRLGHGPIAVYLYGLDSTEVHAAPYARWRDLLAYGYVTPQQLQDLEALVQTERSEPRIRIVALHHPLIYPRTRRVPWLGTLINLDSDVLPTLQRLGFSIALCGHQHTGFVRQTSASNTTYPALQVFSVGTSTQQTKQLLMPQYSNVPAEQKPLWEAAAQRCNEYRLYDFACDPQTPAQLSVTVRSFRYDLAQFTFSSNENPLRIPIDIIA